ncbi:MAG: ABC transporter-like protein, osmoprotectant transport system ATP-binding protein [Candidatus Dadabacteria bacterium CSP1-2]|jgi:osmoprotectant transport system ATP-binding protein|nr:MAG: ABC transporter-like protein, osmoprotectant transport system ATP-binding protein [Candidatus Dadabacteria bacterium CSP1-2]OGE22637.1 MAG: ABC transporter ATP-binding protein [Candidatus Dadabacteria bacterium RBG_19FT_COMBO_40_33]
MIKLENISKTYASTRALDSINLTILPHKTTVVIGPSGCGKSTLIRLIIGLIKPDKGNVYVKDEMLTPINLFTIRRRMGYVIQDGGLFPHLTAKENVSLMAKYLGWDNDRIGKRIVELCELTKFPVDALDRYPVQISGGQRQRVSLMRALILDPDTLLLDEPLGALDPLIRFELQNDLKEVFHTLGKTVVMVTHDIGEAGYFGDSIVLIRDGHIVQQGTLMDFVRTPTDPFVTSFINAQRSPLESLGE